MQPIKCSKPAKGLPGTALMLNAPTFFVERQVATFLGLAGVAMGMGTNCVCVGFMARTTSEGSSESAGGKPNQKVYAACEARLRTLNTSSRRSDSTCDSGNVSTASVSPIALKTSTE